MRMKYYVAYYRSSLGYIDEESGLRTTTVEVDNEGAVGNAMLKRVRAAVKAEDSFCRGPLIYARTEGHRDLTPEEEEGVRGDEMGEGVYGGGYGFNDPKNEPRDL